MHSPIAAQPRRPRLALAAWWTLDRARAGGKWVWGGLLALSLTAWATVAAPAPAAPLWDRTFNVRAGFGYRDNLLLSSANPERSAFWTAGLDLMVFRLATAGPQASLMFSGDELRFLSGQRVHKEQSFFTLAQLKHTWPDAWEGVLTFQHFYQDQVFDVSASEVGLSTVAAQGHNLAFKPAMRRTGPGGWKVEIELPLERQFLIAPLDDYWEGGPRLLLGREYGRGAAVSLAYDVRRRAYDTRVQSDEFGFSLPDEALTFHLQRVEVAWRHPWDAGKRWRTTLKTGFEANRDNGPGYFDYDRFFAVAQVQFERRPWLGRLQARWSHYQYALQTVSDTDLRRREKTGLTFGVRLERSLSRRVKAFLEAEREASLANQSLDAYRVHTVTGGVDVEF